MLAVRGRVREGELFTREAEPASGLPLVRVCRGCAPFSGGEQAEAVKNGRQGA